MELNGEYDQSWREYYFYLEQTWDLDMKLFDHILSAIDNPDQQASSSQLSNILSIAQQLGRNQGADSSTTQAILSILGGHVRSALQERAVSGQAQAIVSQYGGTTPNSQAVQALFTPRQQEQAIQDVAQRTGLNSAAIQAMLPVLIPLVLSLLNSGTNTQNSQGANPVLNAFLDTDRDGDTDMGDTMKIIGGFLN